MISLVDQKWFSKLNQTEREKIVTMIVDDKIPSGGFGR